MTDWATFATVTVALTLLLLYFTRRTQRTLERVRIVDSRDCVGVGGRNAAESAVETDDSDTAGSAVETGDSDAAESAVETGDSDAATVDADRQPFASDDPTPTAPPPHGGEPVLTTAALLANAALSQLLALAVLVGVAWWAGVPASAFGIGDGNPALGTVGASWIDSIGPVAAAGVGAVVGGILYLGNELAAGVGARVGVSPSVRLREAMAPGDTRGWALLLGVALPIVAVFEEALFRGALIGALALGLAVDPWLLAVGSSVAFGLGHGAQGRLGIVVTALLGFALAAVFIATGSVLVVIAAHYVVNVLEFIVREGLDIEPV